MTKRVLPIIACLCLLLCGCGSMLDRSYITIEEHSNKYWESGAAGTLRAENYQDIVNDLLILVGQHTETAVVRLYNYRDDLSVTDALDQAIVEVQQETPVGAYAVEYITCSTHAQRSYYEADVQISYRRTLEQIQAVVNATSTAALSNLLHAALDAGQSELAVRIGYWNDDDSIIDSIAAQVREERGLTETPSWALACYPANGTPGLIEFIFDPDSELYPNLGTDEGDTSSESEESENGETASGEPANGETASGESANGETASGEPANGETASGEPANGETASGESANGETASGEPANGETASGEPANGETASGESANGETASGESANGETASGESANGETASGEPANGSSSESESPVMIPATIRVN